MAASTSSRSRSGPTSSTDGATRLQGAAMAVVVDERPRTVEADIAHDLNNLMTTVAGFTELAIDSLGDDHPAAADLQHVVDAAEQAGILTRRLLAMHRPVADASTDLEGADVQPLAPASIVLADDDPAIREVARRALAGAGHHVVTARDGASALRAAQEMDTVDLLVTDVDMPRLDGLQLADALRARHPGAAILYVSGGDQKRLADRLDQPGVAWLEKPFSGGALVAVVETVLRATMSPVSAGSGAVRR